MVLWAPLQAQLPVDADDYQALMGIGDYDAALKVLRQQLNEILGGGLKTKRVPAVFYFFQCC
jgi:hypothetical protein